MRVFVIGALSLALLVACNPNRTGMLAATERGDTTYGPVEHASFDGRLHQTCGAEAPAIEGAFGRAPYVQQVTGDSAWVVWTSRAPTPYQVRYAADGVERTRRARVDESATTGEDRQFRVRLTGLPASKVICYELWDETRRVFGPSAMRTAAADRVRFIAIGDLGSRTNDQAAVATQLRLVESDLLVITGDVAYDDGTQRQLDENFFAVYADLLQHVPAYPALGNHDARTRSGGPLLESFVLPANGRPGALERTYSFDHGPVHFVVLDTERIDDAQAAWLDRDLAATRQPWRVAVMHKPAYSSGHHGSDRKVRAILVPVLERHGAQLLLAGHDHDYERTNAINGMVHIVTGGGGRGTRRMGRSDFTAFGTRVAHFVYITADAEQLTLQAIDATGQLFDSARLTIGR